ncbi:MAG TPA: A24 family peptidase [Candidatus Dormibacteraeota bacterium]|jgi:Flp pilus assembly protein protease CpaA|nr:A24 family peptidase [Candidatus Dormibacteraeota bacterium]
MNGAAIAGAAVGGALAGLLSGRAAVWLERAEKLEEEEAEDRQAYEQEVALAVEAAANQTQPAPVAEPWKGERYGLTWLEKYLSPLLGAIGFAAFTAHDLPGAGLAIHLVWVAALVHILAFDLKHRLILNRVTYPAVVVALALSPLSPGLTFPRALFGAVVVWLFFMVQSLAFGGSAIGQGDAKLGALVGATTGLALDSSHLGALYAVITAVLLGGAAAVVLLVTRIRGLKDPIPYGPFLCAGAALIMFHGL